VRGPLFLRPCNGYWKMLQIALFAQTHPAAYDLYERTARCKFIGQVDFSSRLEMTCNETDCVRKSRRWRHCRPTWPHLEGPSRLKSTYSTRLAGLTTMSETFYTNINHRTVSTLSARIFYVFLPALLISVDVPSVFLLLTFRMNYPRLRFD